MGNLCVERGRGDDLINDSEDLWAQLSVVVHTVARDVKHALICDGSPQVVEAKELEETLSLGLSTEGQSDGCASVLGHDSLGALFAKDIHFKTGLATYSEDNVILLFRYDTQPSSDITLHWVTSHLSLG